MLTLIYVLSLYADLFIFTGNNDVNEGNYLYLLIIIIPYPLILSMVINLLIKRSDKSKKRKDILIQKIFPLACLILVVGQFALFSNISTSIAVVISISITIILLILSVYLLMKDLMK